ncbi:hypothetical protein D1B31_11875 [Neobacillus notoginsengisoli]|uniref:Uncharacterized protein n=1 Tax=Neobacillus notoginsengisoli TaxID=1578198 RepID=A0A417YT52_9BACI|nr:YwdI family protein [Neobacillus notoginsengisoli]RHW40248.1 hypothetical protein D1B31_11875 [Neobacillus notoginsengisoli]
MKLNIHINKLLSKIGDELALAKSADREELLREKISSIKTLCEVILDGGKAGIPEPERLIEVRPVGPVRMQGNQEQRLEENDGANGDSIFDF